ncbi:hypothetical protein TTRE_0000324001 [Trichuris trichiura]|uniref:Uncharacterized protein n=1 Tax=Trichuris trichiura TaxID=36087 RepID=A0A077Z8F0_TRITR|nr:hypothetical protein TTRE_0000324001 [Trichuris trichiura]
MPYMDCRPGHQKTSGLYTPYIEENGRVQRQRHRGRAIDAEKCSETAMAPFITSYFSKEELNYQKMFITDLLFGREMYLPPDDKGNALREICKHFFHAKVPKLTVFSLEKRAYKESMNNLAKCPPTTRDYYDKRRFVLFNFECIDHFADMAAIKVCTINSSMSAGKQCSKTCDRLRPVTARQIQQLPGKEIQKIFDRVNMTTLYNESCRFVSCFIDCLTKAMEAGCNKRSADLYMQESQIAFKTLNQIYAELEMTENDWPTPCRELASKIG